MSMIPIIGARVVSGGTIAQLATAINTEIQAGRLPFGEPWEVAGTLFQVSVAPSRRYKDRRFVSATAVRGTTAGGAGSFQTAVTTALDNKDGAIISNGIAANGDVLAVIGYYRV